MGGGQDTPWCFHNQTQTDGFPAAHRCVGSEDVQFLASYDAEKQMASPGLVQQQVMSNKHKIKDFTKYCREIEL